MRKAFSILLMAVVAACGACAVLKPLARPALDMACVLAYGEMDPKQVQQFCKIAEELMPQALDLIAAQRKAGVIRSSAGFARGDAGAPQGCIVDAGPPSPDASPAKSTDAGGGG